MKIIKYILSSLAGLIILLLIIAIFVPKDYTVSVSETINKPKQEVFDYVKRIKNQENYSIWVMQDTNAIMVYTGIDGTVGFTSSWNSKNDQVGEGEQKISRLIDGESVDVDLKFIRPFKGEAKASTSVKSISETQTEVTNQFWGHGSYPMNLMSYFLGRKMIKEAQTQNLKNLKLLLEK